MADANAPALERGKPSFSEFVAMMGALMALTALSIDIMLPALPQIRAAMGLVDENQQQLVVTLYLLGFAAGQLFHGPLSDRFGRRPVLLAGLAVYAAASFACTIAGEFSTLLAARFVQGAANAAPRVIAVAVVRDVYGGRKMAEVMSFVMMVFIIAPVVAPSLGGGLLLVGGWQIVFGALAAFAAAVLAWTALRLPETRPAAARQPLSADWLLQAFGEVVTSRRTLGYTLATGAVFGALLGYVNSAQQLFTEIYRLGPLFPLAFGCAAAAIAIASFVNGRIVGRLGMRLVSHVALIGFLATALAHAGLEAAFGAPPLWVFLALLALSLFCFGLVMPNFNAIAMEPMGRIAGTASSFIGAATTGIAAALGWAIGQRYDGTLSPLLLGFALLGAAALAAILVTERGRLAGGGR